MSNNLADEFNLEDVKTEIVTFKEVLKEIKDIPNPSLIVTTAIEKATIFLDLIHLEVVNGEMSPRYMEVAAGLINTIIQSSGFLSNETQTIFENKLKGIGVVQKDREIDIKQQEADMKKLFLDKKKSGDTTNNMIVTDYNSIIKFLNKDKNPQLEG